MHERPTDNGGRQTAQEVHSQPEAGDPEGMGCLRKWSGGFATPWDSSLDPVSLEEETGTGSCGVSKGNPVQTESGGQGIAKGESEAQGHSDFIVSGTDALEKKDELGLTGRKPGQAYTQEQRQRILNTVERLKSHPTANLKTYQHDEDLKSHTYSFLVLLSAVNFTKGPSVPSSIYLDVLLS